MVIASALHHLLARDYMMDREGAGLAASSGQRKVVPGVRNVVIATYALKANVTVVSDQARRVEIRSCKPLLVWNYHHSRKFVACSECDHLISMATITSL